MRQRASRCFLLLTALPLVLGGCLAGVISESREDQVIDLARFHSRCDRLKVKDSTMGSRFVLEGCGVRYIYACRNRPVDSYHPRETGVISFFLTGGLDAEAECWLTSRSRLLPADERVASLTPAKQSPPAAAASQPAPAKRPTLPRAPSAAAIKKALSALEPRLKSCGVPQGEEGRLQALLRVEPSGKVSQVKVTPAMEQQVQRCVELTLLDARLPPFQGGQPMTLAYLFQLR